mmetsp:Transcript_86888/g.270086  ORF Transcript_86888/g.270086 Transcript_86888/m.270086 type:complete len:238 (-) Transcript_86888:341-1054(-)
MCRSQRSLSGPSSDPAAQPSRTSAPRQAAPFTSRCFRRPHLGARRACASLATSASRQRSWSVRRLRSSRRRTSCRGRRQVNCSRSHQHRWPACPLDHWLLGASLRHCLAAWAAQEVASAASSTASSAFRNLGSREAWWAGRCARSSAAHRLDSLRATSEHVWGRSPGSSPGSWVGCGPAWQQRRSAGWVPQDLEACTPSRSALRHRLAMQRREGASRALHSGAPGASHRRTCLGLPS